MKRWLSSLLVALMIVSLVPVAIVSAAAPIPPFQDVLGTDIQDAVGYLHAAGLISGTSDKTYSPTALVTRAQMAALVVRALGVTAKDGTSVAFRDVPTTHWAHGVIVKAVASGIVRGTSDTTFEPDATVTQAQMLTMLLRAIGYDQLSGDFPVPQVMKSLELGWLDGLNFDVSANATRRDAAKVLFKAVFQTPGASGKTLSQSGVQKAVSLQIEAPAPYLTVGANKLSALGADWFGKTFPLQGVSWRGFGDGFSIATDGTVTVTNADKVSVTASAGTFSGERTFDVVQSLKLSGGESGIETGKSVTITAQGTSPRGTTVNVRPVWRVTSGNGSITPEGVLTSTGSGSIKVEATVGPVRSEITVISAASVAVTPTETTLAIGQTQKFEAKVLNEAGTPISLPVTWSVIQGSGTITPDGVLTAGSSGPIKVQASAGGITGQATIRLISQLVISPSPSTVAKGGTIQFTATAKTLDGTSIPVQPIWSASGGVGIINQTGLLIGTVAGSGSVTADYFGLKGSSTLSVSGEPTAIRLETSKAALAANGATTATLTATVVDVRGLPAHGRVETITFSLSSSNLGTISASTVKVVDGKATVTFTPSEQSGQVLVYASAPGTSLSSGFVTITTVVPSIARIKLEAYPQTLAADNISRTTITATLEDANGVTIKNPTGAPISLSLVAGAGATSVLDSSIMTIPAATASATTSLRATAAVGTTSISGVAAYTVTPVSVQTVIVGPAAQLRFRTPITETKADGTQLMSVKVELLDASGYVRTGDSSTIIQLSATSGSTVLSTQTQNTLNGIATFNLTSTTAGSYTLRATSTTAGVSAAENTGTFVAGPASKVMLSVEPGVDISADNVSKVRLIAKVTDQFGNVVKSAANAVTFTKTANQGATAITNSQDILPVDGLAVLETRATAVPGTDTFVASSTGLTASAPFSITSRITGSAYKVRVQSPSAVGVTVGQSVTVAVHVLDSLDQLITNINGRPIGLIVSSPTAVVTGSNLTAGGLATFTITDTKSGTLTITATSAGLQADTVGRTVTVSPGTVSTIRLAASPEGIAADNLSYTTLSAVATDNYGNSVPWATAITLQTSNTTAGRLTSTVLYSGGQTTLFSTAVPGSITITGTGSGLTVVPVTISTYVPSVPARVVVEQVPSSRVSDPFVSATTFRVRVLDTNGNLATGVNTGTLMSSIGITISGSGGTNTTRVSTSTNSGLGTFAPNGITSAAAPVTYGMATFQITNTRAETVILNPIAYYNGVPLPATVGTFTTTPDVASKIVVTPSSLVLTAQVPMPLSITAAVSDRFDNPIATESDTFTFTPGNTTHLTFPDTLTVPTTNGVASIMVTSKVSTLGGTTPLTITSTRTGLSVAVTVSTDLPPAQPTVSATNISVTSTTVPVSDGMVRIQVNSAIRQSHQNVLVYVNGQLKNIWAEVAVLTAAGGLSIGQTSWIGYVRTADFAAGNNTVTVLLSNGLGLSPLSNSATVTIQ